MLLYYCPGKDQHLRCCCHREEQTLKRLTFKCKIEKKKKRVSYVSQIHNYLKKKLKKKQFAVYDYDTPVAFKQGQGHQA